DHDVRWFQVAMQYSTGMRKRHCVANPQKKPEPRGKGIHGGEKLIEPRTFYELHHIKNSAIRQHTRVVNRHDAGMLELCQHAGFAVQAFSKHTDRVSGIEDLDGHHASENSILSAKDGSH